MLVIRQYMSFRMLAISLIEIVASFKTTIYLSLSPHSLQIEDLTCEVVVGKLIRLIQC